MSEKTQANEEQKRKDITSAGAGKKTAAQTASDKKTAKQAAPAQTASGKEAAANRNSAGLEDATDREIEEILGPAVPAHLEKAVGGDTAIEIRDLCISYRDLGSYSIKKMLLKGRRRRTADFQAVKHVSFDVYQGEILGIIGRNGCGKSTMLRAIAGIMSPNAGTIDLKGNSVSLLSIGVGFNKYISGRENIILSGMLLGYSEDYLLERMDDIIEFSELGDFIDRPVRTYSSGMYSKLAFSVTVMLDTSIILVDEVLSVGDEHFRTKSRDKMKEIISDKNRTVVIVSHSIRTLLELCTRVMWMQDGKIKKIGDPKQTLHEYKEAMR